MGRKRKVGTALVTATLAAGTYFATSASASTPNSPNTANAPSTATSTTPARVFAVINANGTKVRAKALASAVRLGTGVYDVRWNRNITSCAWTATVGVGAAPFGGSTNPAMVTASGRAGTNNGLFIQTFNGSGAPADQPFLVVVICS